jgi:hypothetical protein
VREQVTIRNMKQLVRLVEDYLERHKAAQREASTSATAVAPLDGDIPSSAPPTTTTTTTDGGSDGMTLDGGHPPPAEAAQPEQPHDPSPPPSLIVPTTADDGSVATNGASDDVTLHGTQLGAAQPEPSQAPSEQPELHQAQPDTLGHVDKESTEAEEEKKETTKTTTPVFEPLRSRAACTASASTTFLRFDVGERNSVIVLDTAFVVREEAAILATHSIAHPKSTDLFASTES